MIAKFDSFERFEKPTFYVCNPGCVYENGTLSNVSGALAETSDEELIMNFNSTSELNFRVYQNSYGDAEEQNYHKRLYNSLENRRLIFLDDIGFFMITNCKPVKSRANGNYKDVKAESCEVELQKENIPFIQNGTYRLYSTNAAATGSDKGLLNMLIETNPLWTVKEVDTRIAQTYRTFEDVDTSKSILDFMLSDMQDAYECIFAFDILKREIYVYDQNNYVKRTDIHLTNDDFIESLEIEEKSDDLYTALRVIGSDDLDINAVNPLGTSIIYDFSHYTSWMSEELGKKVEAWQAAVKEAQAEYYALNIAYYGSKTQESAYNSELDKLNTQYEMYKKCKENIVAEASAADIAAYNKVIEEVGGIKIPLVQTYTWVKFADNELGSNLTGDPYGKNYIGIAYDKTASAESLDSKDYEWSLFRDDVPVMRNADGTYTWVVFATSPNTGMTGNPDSMPYMGIRIGNTSADKSEQYSDYAWRLVDKDNVGVPQVLTLISEQIVDTENEIAAKKIELNALHDAMETQNNNIGLIRSSLVFDSYFTEQELKELSCYIFEGEYTDEYITVTDSMTYSERLEQINELYKKGQNQLSKISSPTQEISVDLANFIFSKQFIDWTTQLETGCLVNVELDTNDVAEMFLCTITVNYSDRSLSMTFGNRFNRFDIKALYENALGSVSKTASTVSFIKDLVAPIENGGFDEMKQQIQNSRDLTKNYALSSSNQRVTIDDTGYTGRSVKSDGTIDPHQIKINGKNIVFTDDAWETCKTAIGEMILSGDSKTYGINAETIIGELIVGRQLRILDDDGKDRFTVTEDSIKAYVGDKFADKADAISTVDVEYCRASSSLICDDTTITSPWSTSAPVWKKDGEFVWQRTKTILVNDVWKYSNPTCISSSTGTGITSTEISYAFSDSGEIPPTEWQDVVPEGAADKFLWTRTTIVYTDKSTSTSYSVSLSGSDGDGVVSTEITYAASASGTIEPPLWSDTVPKMAPGQYLWTKTETTFTDGSKSVSFAISREGIDGGEIQIEKIVEEYCRTNSASKCDSTTITDDWSEKSPDYVEGEYIWTRSKIFWSDGSEATTSPVVSFVLNSTKKDLNSCVTDIQITKTGLEQNNTYYNDLYGRMERIDAYIQTGALNLGEGGKTTFGVKIGENISSVDAYVVPGAETFSDGWLTTIEGGTALIPMEDVIYIIKSNGAYFGKSYRWMEDDAESKYVETDSQGSLSAIFTSNELAFYDTGEKLAFFSNKNLNVKAVRTGKILLSNSVMGGDISSNNWLIGTDNGFYIKWIGGNV